jgi:hypothetical protein
MKPGRSLIDALRLTTTYFAFYVTAQAALLLKGGGVWSGGESATPHPLFPCILSSYHLKTTDALARLFLSH